MKWLKAFLSFVLAAITILALGWFFLNFFKSSNALLEVTTPGVKSKVFLDGRELGTTKFLGEKLQVGDHTLHLVGEIAGVAKKVEFSTQITLTSQALTAVNYDFGPNQEFSSGDIRTLRPGSGLSVVTTPNGAEVSIDGQPAGKSPLSKNPTQGVHKLRVVKSGFATRELEINIEPNFRTVVEVFLSAIPFGEAKKLEDGRLKLYDLSTDQASLLSNPSAWSEGVFFFEKNANVDFDALIDTSGNVYYQKKAAWDDKVKKNQEVVVGYLGRSADKALTEKAKAALENLKKVLGEVVQAAPQQPQAQVQILATPTGTLNVRSGPSQNNPVIAKVNPGETYPLLEESAGWYKIKLADKDGWISSQYAKKL